MLGSEINKQISFKKKENNTYSPSTEEIGEEECSRTTWVTWQDIVRDPLTKIKRQWVEREKETDRRQRITHRHREREYKYKERVRNKWRQEIKYIRSPKNKSQHAHSIISKP